MTAEIIDLKAAAASRRHSEGGSAPRVPKPSDYDTLACMYCGVDVAPSQVNADFTVIYRCSCRKVFRVVESGEVHRGLAGPAF